MTGAFMWPSLLRYTSNACQTCHMLMSYVQNHMLMLINCWIWIMFVVFLYKTFHWFKYVCIKTLTCVRFLLDFIVWPTCLETEKARDRNGQTEKSCSGTRAPLWKLQNQTFSERFRVLSIFWTGPSKNTWSVCSCVQSSWNENHH